jgi:hypothetical protein
MSKRSCAILVPKEWSGEVHMLLLSAFATTDTQRYFIDYYGISFTPELRMGYGFCSLIGLGATRLYEYWLKGSGSHARLMGLTVMSHITFSATCSLHGAGICYLGGLRPSGLGKSLAQL